VVAAAGAVTITLLGQLSVSVEITGALIATIKQQVFMLLQPSVA
jgi:hypothetical protein